MDPDRLAALVGEATARWPEVSVPPEEFARYLDARLPAGEPEGVVVPDLYLACACAAGDARAIRELDRVFRAEIGAAAARLGASRTVEDEASQVVRQLVLGPRASGIPAILTYSGRAELRSWLRVIAIRELLRLQRAARPDRPYEDDALHDLLSSAQDPEIEHLKRLYRGELEEALREAIAALTPEQRTLLRLECIDGLTIDEVGGLYRVHRATAARRMARARNALAAATRAALTRRLGGSAEIDSVLRLLQSRLDISLGRHLD